MYYKTIIKAGKTIEIYKSYRKRVGTSKRSEREKLTKEEMNKINELNAERKLRIKINSNFKEGDPFITLTYKKNMRPTSEEAKKNLKKFIKMLRKTYRQQGTELKYIAVTEYKNKAIHHHLLINDFNNIAKIICKMWRFGNPHFKFLDNTGQYKDLAAYLIKETSKTFRDENISQKQRYSCSRNLIMPKPKTEIIRADKWATNPKAIKGYYVDQDTICNGIDRFTNREYQRYTLIELGQLEENPFLTG